MNSSFSVNNCTRSGAEVHLYWLSGNATERLYARLPAGKRVYETTYAGQCWRARDPISGNHVASYCATSEPHQTVRLGASDDVDIDFHFDIDVDIDTSTSTSMSTSTLTSASASTSTPRRRR